MNTLSWLAAFLQGKVLCARRDSTLGSCIGFAFCCCCHCGLIHPPKQEVEKKNYKPSCPL
ncbi:hypothetical protein LEMLEM_LOCUS22493 [Lemmus lemmus]